MLLKFSRAAAAAALAAAIVAPASASAAIVDIDATSSSAVSYTFLPGSYRIQWAGVAGGGQFNGFNLNCPGGVCPESGWRDDFFAHNQAESSLSRLGLFNQSGPLQFASALAALNAYKNAPGILDIDIPFQPGGVEVHPQPWFVHVDAPLTIDLFIADDTRRDNVGGVSLSITPAPEPGVWALMLSGFAAVGAMLRRRRSAAAMA